MHYLPNSPYVIYFFMNITYLFEDTQTFVGGCIGNGTYRTELINDESRKRYIGIEINGGMSRGPRSQLEDSSYSGDMMNDCGLDIGTVHKVSFIFIWS